ncbi:uncharacterized protein J4E87_009979 [Alternaria ethzedia]|uniref:uncharacterized protein n=1 Tax=Alternaria ethzedia TaxID=181014 RepID=UPI0020C4DA19|nr:uncharacterized protein J4E87_009979 [Alternaria ethzedia]KAI4613332.1 hypothetical protein J4E87_009979 [Alternaria ethzedia]
MPAIAPDDKDEDEDEEDESLDGGGGMALDAAFDRTSDAVAGAEEGVGDAESDADEVTSEVGDAELGCILELLVGAALALASDTSLKISAWHRVGFFADRWLVDVTARLAIGIVDAAPSFIEEVLALGVAFSLSDTAERIAGVAVRQNRKKTHRETVMNEPAIGQADLVLKAEGNNAVRV